MSNETIRTALIVGGVVILAVIVGAVLYGEFGVRPQNEATIHVEQINDSSENVSKVPFEELSQEQQQDFERALNDPDGASRTQAQWTNVDYVSHQDTVYSVSVIVI